MPQVDTWLPTLLGSLGVGRNDLDVQPSAGAIASGSTHVRYYRNTDRDRWATVHNPLSIPLVAGSVLPQSSTPPIPRHIIPPLTVETFAIDPDSDFAIMLGSRGIPLRGRQSGTNAAAPSLLNTSTRTILVALDQDGSAFSREMFPLRGCAIVTRQASGVAAAASVVYAVSPDDVAGGAILVWDGRVSALGGGPPAYPDEACIMAIQVVVQSLGATATTDQVIGSYQYTAAGIAQDVVLFGGSAAGATGLAGNSGIIPIPGASAVQIFNNNSGATPAIAFLISIWVGMPYIRDHFLS